MIVDNRPGAGGNLAAGILARTNPDGYTFMNISTAHTISQTLYTRLDYSLERDLTPVVVLGNSPLIMVVTQSVPAKNVAEFVNWAKNNKMSYVSGGVGLGGTSQSSAWPAVAAGRGAGPLRSSRLCPFPGTKASR